MMMGVRNYRTTCYIYSKHSSYVSHKIIESKRPQQRKYHPQFIERLTSMRQRFSIYRVNGFTGYSHSSAQKASSIQSIYPPHRQSTTSSTDAVSWFAASPPSYSSSCCVYVYFWVLLNSCDAIHYERSVFGVDCVCCSLRLHMHTSHPIHSCIRSKFIYF